MDTIYTFGDVIAEADDKIRALLNNSETKSATPRELNLDDRCGYNMFVVADGIVITRNSKRSLEYYGGFEYVDREHVHEVGGWVFYSDEDERVRDAIDFYHAYDAHRDEEESDNE